MRNRNTWTPTRKWHSLLGRSLPGTNRIFGINTQPVGHAIDIVEVGHHLHRIVDGRVIEPGGPQAVQVRGIDPIRFPRQFLGVGGKRAVGVAQRRIAPRDRDRVDKPVRLVFIGDPEAGGDLGTEVVGMRAYSVKASVYRRDHHRQHLALPPAQG